MKINKKQVTNIESKKHKYNIGKSCTLYSLGLITGISIMHYVPYKIEKPPIFIHAENIFLKNTAFINLDDITWGYKNKDGKYLVHTDTDRLEENVNYNLWMISQNEDIKKIDAFPVFTRAKKFVGFNIAR